MGVDFQSERYAENAADEIARLRAELDQARATIAELDAENESRAHALFERNNALARAERAEAEADMTQSRLGAVLGDLAQARVEAATLRGELPQSPPAGDHQEIWLQPWCKGCADYGYDGRQWCQDDAWGQCPDCDRKPTKYIIAPFLTVDLEDNTSTPDWHERALRTLAAQLRVPNDYYYPLIEASRLLAQNHTRAECAPREKIEATLHVSEPKLSQSQRPTKLSP